jgi:hypothetical protein
MQYLILIQYSNIAEFPASCYKAEANNPIIADYDIEDHTANII